MGAATLGDLAPFVVAPLVHLPPLYIYIYIYEPSLPLYYIKEIRETLE